MKEKETYQEMDWQEEAPLLASLPPKRLPPVPEAYFEGLPAQVMDRIRAEDAAKPAATASNPRRIWIAYLAVAASVAAALFLTHRWAAQELNGDGAKAPGLAEVESRAVHDALDLPSLPEETLLGYLSDADLSSLEQEQDLLRPSSQLAKEALQPEDLSWDDLDPASVGESFPDFDRLDPEAVTEELMDMDLDQLDLSNLDIQIP